jgi:NAD(P)-dependent dehydrogenase (short-subunit alcohol dehydrogenase family)
VVVNDLGGAVDGSGGSVSAAQAVVDEIRAAGGEAIANGASVTDFAAVQAMVRQAIDTWGRVDILVNNAGILRDKSFAKMEIADFRLVMDVHVMGAVHCSKAVWPHHDGAEIRPHCHDHLVQRPVWQLRAGQLRSGQDGAGRPDADPVHRGAKSTSGSIAWPRPPPPA